MRFALKRCAVAGILLAGAGRALAIGGEAAPAVDVKIVADVSCLQAGKAFQVAVIVTPQAGWHVYWKNPGDAGLPTKVKWELPAGFVAGELEYPIPTKILQPGSIVAYGYEGKTTFLATITPPRELQVGEMVTLKGNVSWLCCEEECVPGHRAVAMSLPVAGDAVPANAEIFEKAETAMPADSPRADVVSSTKITEEKRAEGEIFTLHIGWKRPVAAVDLFPTNVQGLDVSDIHATTQGDKTRVTFTGRVMAGQKLAVEEIPMLVVYTDVDGGRRGFYSQVNLRSLSSVGP